MSRAPLWERGAAAEWPRAAAQPDPFHLLWAADVVVAGKLSGRVRLAVSLTPAGPLR